VLNALERLAGGDDKQAATARQDLAIAEGQRREYDSRLGAPFVPEAYLAELTSARDRLKAALSGATPEPGAAPIPAAHEIAAHIKALKSAHSIEPAPERTKARRSAAAEEPVTARFRRRIDPPVEPEPVVELEHPAPPAITEPILLRIDAVLPAPAMPKPTYQDRVSRDKPRKARQMSMF